MIATYRMPLDGLAKGATVVAEGIRVTDEYKTKVVGTVVAARVPYDGVLELDIDVEDPGLFRVSAEHLSIGERG